MGLETGAVIKTEEITGEVADRKHAAEIKASNLPRLAYSPDEVAEMLSISKAFVRGQIRNGKLKAKNLGDEF